MVSPYHGLPPRAFWRSGVAQQNPRSITDLYRKKFSISPTDAIATAGSCFAQHIARNLKACGYNVLDVEPAPPGLRGEHAARFGYGIYSARFGNIYVPRQLLQLLLEASGRFTPENHVWERDGRYFDALRPGVEPDGLSSPDEVLAHRKRHLTAVLRLIRSTDIFVFTLGLTEAWIDRQSGTVYATAPETIAGHFDPERYEFKNFNFIELYRDFLGIRKILKRVRRDLRFILTVSPVPLTATAGPEHVLAATIYSKSVLRAVAGQLSSEFEDTDYFPSYELIASHFSRGAFYEPNLRSVTEEGVAAAMQIFLAEHGIEQGPPPAVVDRFAAPAEDDDGDDLICEDILLEAFAK